MLRTDQANNTPQARRSMAWAVLWLTAAGAIALSFVADSLGYRNVAVLLRVFAALAIVGFLMLVFATFARARRAADTPHVSDEQSRDRPRHGK